MNQDMIDKLKVAEQELSKPIGQWTYPKILIAMPLERVLINPWQTMRSMIKFAQEGAGFLWRPYGRTDLTRNRFALKLLTIPTYTHVLMLDADHEHPADLVRRLARWTFLGDDYKVIAGMNFQRLAPHKPCHYLYGEEGREDEFDIPLDWTGGLEEVAMTGTGSILIHRDVFMDLEPPYFYYDYSFAMEDIYPGEDVGFCAKLRKAGIKMWVDTSVYSPHISDTLIGPKEFKRYYDKYGLMTDDEREKVMDNEWE